MFDWLVAGDDRYEVTDRGRDSAELGFYQWEPPKPAAAPNRARK